MAGLGVYTQLAYCSTRRCQLWASLVEKAFAKVCGSYAATAGGEANEAIAVLTGWPCDVVRFDREDFDADVLWASLSTSRDAQFLMTCSTGRAAESCESVGLVPNHAYSLIDVLDFADQRRGRLQLLKIRNPHAKSKWRGAWSDSSSDWTPALRKELGVASTSQGGSFFMAFGDFLLWFERCTICRVRHEGWSKARLPKIASQNKEATLQITRNRQHNNH
ncbi:unnamed protein product [Polarella glacialis]|uniref:Calpain catalytic domain-containing protein n=1 Tax=Polarella glacialis TaxID=89957 RepID=A0A813K4I0_POLGL|nr:unnamed protein product [Polarella glacialis]CAE8693836.1 unnamed protein product [Polarella glacialis]